MTNNNFFIETKIKRELDKIRPKLALDGGNIEFINFNDGILKVRMLGECAHCSLAEMTLKYAIEDTIKQKIPEVKKVLNVKLNLI